MNNTMILQKLEQLKQYFDAGQIPVLHKHEVNPGLALDSRENYLYFIMTCSLNFQRISPNTWKAALATRNDQETNFVFFPEKVAQTEEEYLRKALLKHKLALQTNKHIHIWKTIAHTFHKFFNDDPRKLFEICKYDTAQVLHLTQKVMKKDFPYLSGPKLSNYFIFIL